MPGVPQIRTWRAHRTSGLRRLTGEETPYWAYHWAGGSVLARHILENPQIVSGKHVVDYGAGSGIVGIVAALSGAASVCCVEIDFNGHAAIALNAEANNVGVSVSATMPPASDMDLILAGDIFYNTEIAALSLKRLQEYTAAGIDVLIGDPGRRDLPLADLDPLASHPVPDFGDPANAPPNPATVYRLKPA